MKHPFLPACLIAAFLAASVPSLADTLEKPIQDAFEAMASAQSEEAFYGAARTVVALGSDALPDLTKRLAAAKDDDERLNITYVLANIVGQMKLKREAIELPPELVSLTGKLLLETRNTQLEANLANFSVVAPHPAEFGPGLLALLERTEDQALRATASAAIVYQGAEVLPLVQDAFYRSTNDRFTGDLARVLYDTELSEQSIAKLQDLLKSDNSEARQLAARTLDKAGIKSSDLLESALKDLASARTEVELSFAASKVRKHTDLSERVAAALASAFERAHRIEERVELVSALLATGEPGKTQLFAVLQASNDPEEIGDLTRVTNTRLQDDPRLSAAYIAILKRTDDEKVSEAAIHGLVMARQPGREAIEAALKEQPADERLRRRLTKAASFFTPRTASD
ncbi:hypothetical protein [Bordetella sp. BOR01]|uniref:hypothetical protein n=1 Tax=Bordetella sp. BOR01 TaxID=2854779 RepID=UPI001C457597|nr:hypothetical protein [Bordetella sp. BOR01]MBV7483227.1 hypothetical protein [Bordetella sp. BOR01]